MWCHDASLSVSCVIAERRHTIMNFCSKLALKHKNHFYENMFIILSVHNWSNRKNTQLSGWKHIFSLYFVSGVKVLIFLTCVKHDNLILLMFFLNKFFSFASFVPACRRGPTVKALDFSNTKYTHCRSLDSLTLKKLERTRREEGKGRLIVKDCSKLNACKERNFNGIFFHSKLRAATASRYFTRFLYSLASGSGKC